MLGSGRTAGCPRSTANNPRSPDGSRAVIRACGRKRFVDWAFGHYLRIAPPEFAGSPPQRSDEPEAIATAA